MKFVKNKVILPLGMIFFLTTSIVATANNAMTSPTQEIKSYKGTWWINLGGGAASVEIQDSHAFENYVDTNASAALTGVSFNYALFDTQFLTLRVTHASDITHDSADFSLEDSTVDSLDNITEVGVLYGLMHKREYFLAAASVGIAYVNANYERYEYEYDDRYDDTFEVGHESRTESTVGLPAEVQLFFTPTDVFGIGFIGTGNLNSEASFIGGMLGIQVGNLR